MSAPVKRTQVPLSGTDADRRAAIGRGDAAVRAALSTRFPASEAYSIRYPDQRARVQQQGHASLTVAKVRRGRFSAHVAVLARSVKEIELVTMPDSVIPSLLLYLLMAAGVTVMTILVTQTQGAKMQRYVGGTVVGLVLGGAVGSAIDKLVPSSLDAPALVELHDYLVAALERGTRGA